MNVKVLSVIALVVLVEEGWSFTLENMLINFEDCGSQFELTKLSMSSCSTLPCSVEGGNFVTFTAEFDTQNSPYSSNSLNHEAFWIIDGIVQSAIVYPDICNNDGQDSCLRHISSNLLEFTSEVFVSAYLPKVNGLLHFRSKNVYGDVLMCYKVPVKIQ